MRLVSWLLSLLLILVIQTGCGVYGFSEKNPRAIPDSIHTVRVQIVENRAPYVNPRVLPALTESIKQKILRQTRLTNTNGDDADWDIATTVTDYSVTTSGVTNQNGRAQGSINRLNVSVHVVLTNRKANTTQEYDVSRQFDYSGTQTLQQAENNLFDEIIRNITDEIFNRLFSDW
jgi:outer membrane lipopolysaccharide assembly protein LptE/RlpB